MARTLGELIRHRLAEMDGRSQADLRRALERAGARVKRQSVHAWLADRARPGTAHMLALLDVLLIPESERRAWLEAQAVPIPRGMEDAAEHA